MLEIGGRLLTLISDIRSLKRSQMQKHSFEHVAESLACISAV